MTLKAAVESTQYSEDEKSLPKDISNKTSTLPQLLQREQIPIQNAIFLNTPEPLEVTIMQEEDLTELELDPIKIKEEITIDIEDLEDIKVKIELFDDDLNQPNDKLTESLVEPTVYLEKLDNSPLLHKHLNMQPAVCLDKLEDRTCESSCKRIQPQTFLKMLIEQGTKVLNKKISSAKYLEVPPFLANSIMSVNKNSSRKSLNYKIKQTASDYIGRNKYHRRSSIDKATNLLGYKKSKELVGDEFMTKFEAVEVVHTAATTNSIMPVDCYSSTKSETFQINQTAVNSKIRKKTRRRPLKVVDGNLLGFRKYEELVSGKVVMKFQAIDAPADTANMQPTHKSSVNEESGPCLEVGALQFTLNYCGRKIVKKCHKANRHTGETLFQCYICDFKAAKKQMLIRHLQMHSGKKPFKCGMCDYRTAESRYLNQHKKIHSTVEKPLKCKFCKYRTGDKYTFKRHIQIHTGEKPFTCGICDYKANRRNTLKRHVLTHTGEKPFECYLCNLRVARKSSLQEHLKTMHSKGLKRFRKSRT